MKYGYVIGLDIGTTGCKAALMDAGGRFYAQAYREYPVVTGADTRAEQDAENVFSLCKAVIREAVEKSRIDTIDAICASVQGDAIIPLDENFRPVHAAILGMDYRPAVLCKEVEDIFPAGFIYQKTGMPIHPINSALKILWLMKNTDMTGTAHYTTYSDFINARLTGRLIIDETMASRTMLYGLETRCWAEAIADKLTIPVEKLSDVAPSGTPAGPLLPGLCAELGIANRPLVIAGAHDQPACALGAGLHREGMAVDSMGTAEVLSTVFFTPRLSQEMESGSFPCYRHAWPDAYFTFALNHTSGIILRWFRDTLCGKETGEARAAGTDFYAYMQKGMQSKPSPILMLPHFNGRGTPYADSSAKGAFAGITLNTDKKDILKGIMDSLTYELRLNIEYLERSGIRMDTLRCVGGGSRSPIWLQSKADILNRRVETLETSECGCLGAGMLAAYGAGLHASIPEAVSLMSRVAGVFDPDEKFKAQYEQKYRAFCKLYDAMSEIDLML